jgi:hypothetical protein
MRFSKGVIGFEYLHVKRNKFLDENGKLRTYLNSNAISDSKIIFIFYQILIKENLSPNLESATIN